MGAVDAIWVSIAAACATLAAIHAYVVLNRPSATAHLAFAVLSASVAVIALLELDMLKAESPAEFGRRLWWYQWPVWTGVVALVFFVWRHLRAGRRWLGWTVIVLRTLTVVANALSDPNVNYREITELVPATMFGDSVVVAVGRPGLWLPLAHLSLLALIAFVADATLTLWRERRRDSSLLLAACLLMFVVTATGVVVVSFWGLVRIPPLVTLLFVPIVLAMGAELSRELVRAAAVSAELVIKDGELRESRRRLELAADAANAGLWGIERATGSLWATPRAIHMLGLEPSGPHRIEDVLQAVHQDDRDRMRAALGEANQDGTLHTLEYRVPGPDGSVRWFVYSGSASDSRAGGFDGITGVSLDITQRRKSEADALLYRSEMERLSRLATLNELSGALAHEINQPLATIMSNAEAAQGMLERSRPDLVELRAMLHDIVIADERAGAVIQRMRALLGRRGLDPMVIECAALLRGVLSFMRTELISRSVQVHLDVPDSALKVEVDRVAMEQVLINLLSNACEAMADLEPEGRRIVLSACEEQGRVRIRVEDHGRGLPVPPEQVFQSFYTTKREGLGLGLAISRSIVQSHGGRLIARNRDGGGAGFIIDLPSMRPESGR
ncbi:MAG: sensor histidine kinase [Pseudomonadota bacterium]